jgi:IS30 family transposase
VLTAQLNPQKKKNMNQKPIIYKHITLEERIIIYEGIKNNYFLKDIAFSLKKTCSAISLEVSRNGGRENYDPYLAQKRYDENKISNKRNKTKYGSTADRLKNLEFQIEILSEIMDKLTKEKQ